MFDEDLQAHLATSIYVWVEASAASIGRFCGHNRWLSRIIWLPLVRSSDRIKLGLSTVGKFDIEL